MKYYRYIDVVIAVPDDTHWRAVVTRMRSEVGKNMFWTPSIMIEDIHTSSEESYNKYISKQNNKK